VGGPLDSTPGRTGLWLVGARGSVATTTALGALAVAAGVAPATGLVTELPEFAGQGLPRWEDLVIGGHDVVPTPLPKKAEALAEAGVVPRTLATALATELAELDGRIRQVDEDVFHGPQAPVAERIAADLGAFAERHGCARVVVINVSSTESPFRPGREHRDPESLERALGGARPVLPRSSLYAYAALRAGCPFVDFTPGAGVRLPALARLAERAGLPWAGSDGKTGETLLRSALAPMFTARALRVRSWAGVNLLGGGDGATLADEAAASSKMASKERSLAGALGYRVDAPLHIDHVPALGEWKTAWDHVRFDGFLGTAMTLQVTWQGCDSALAAPLVLDLARLVARAHEAGERGPLRALAFFFKDPVDCAEHGLAAQYDALLAWAGRLREPAC
jgi:myo-inositol-1-phosphate synthase